MLAFHDFSEECDDELALVAASRTPGLCVDVVVDRAIRLDWLRHVLDGAEARRWMVDGDEIVTRARARLRFFVAEPSAHALGLDGALGERMGAAGAPLLDGWPVRPLIPLLSTGAYECDSVLVAAPLRGVEPALLARVRAERVVVVGDRDGINCRGYDWAACEAALCTSARGDVGVRFLAPALSRRVRLPLAALDAVPPRCAELAWAVLCRFLGERPEGSIAPALCLRINAANASMCERWCGEAAAMASHSTREAERAAPLRPGSEASARELHRDAVDAYVARHSAGLRADDAALLAELRAAGEALGVARGASEQGLARELGEAEALRAAYARALRRSVSVCTGTFARLVGDGAYVRPLESLCELARPAEAVARLQRAGLRTGTPCYDLLGLLLALPAPVARAGAACGPAPRSDAGCPLEATERAELALDDQARDDGAHGGLAAAAPVGAPTIAVPAAAAHLLAASPCLPTDWSAEPDAATVAEFERQLEHLLRGELISFCHSIRPRPRARPSC